MRRSRLLWLLLMLLGGCVSPGEMWSLVVQEQHQLELRNAAQMPSAPLPALPVPETVTNPAPKVEARELSLDEAIRVALANARVIRVLAGNTAVSSGQTIYDTAITNTTIDDARAPFDPILGTKTLFNRNESPQAFLNPADPLGAGIFGTRVDNAHWDMSLAKKNATGGTAKLELTDDFSRFNPGIFPLNPQDSSNAALSYTQPLLKGAGVRANVAPILIARINTERSFFQFKDAMQDLVLGVIEAYWNVVFARVDVWAKQQQAGLGQEGYDRAQARFKAGLATQGEAAQARAALSNFRAAQVSAEANLLQRESALRNILGWSPTEPARLILITPPTDARVEPHWENILRLAADNRPDLIELKLILEADQQSITLANNQARPQVDATMFYRWNGLEGETPTRAHLATGGGQFTDWTLGVNFAVPLGLRQGRATLRRAELVLAKDRANLDQGLHATSHVLAGNLRSLAQFYEQYRAYRETRAAARENLIQQRAEYDKRGGIYLNYLQAISDLSNAVSSEALALTQYNSELANLEKQTGTILETHGIRFSEERFRAIGPLGRLMPDCYFPSSLPPTPNVNRYPASMQPAEKAFQLEMPIPPTILPLPALEKQAPEPARPMLLPPKV